VAAQADTASQLLDAAQVLVQRRGYNAFSYKDLAETVGIRTASIHYHFQAKADLGQALMGRYLAELNRSLAEIDRTSRSQRSKLRSFIDLYRQTETRGAVCLCGSLASDQETLPENLQHAVSAYLHRAEGWVASTLKQGVQDGEFVVQGKPGQTASTLVASLQGALIVSRVRGGASVVDDVQRTFLAALRTP